MKITAFIACFVSLLLYGCTHLNEYVMIEDMKTGNWDREVTLSYENNDSISLRDIIFLMRYDDTFQYNALDFSFAVISPSGDTFCDTLSVEITKTDNTYITVLNLEQRIVKNAKFDSCGTYNFKINPLLELPLEGITGVGLAIGNSK